MHSDQSKSYLRELIKLAKKNLTAIAYQKLTVNSTSGGVSLTVPQDANYALIILESDATGIAIRYLETGPAYPVTTTDGLSRSNGEILDVQGYNNMVNFRAIQAQSGTHTLHIQYYK